MSLLLSTPRGRAVGAAFAKRCAALIVAAAVGCAFFPVLPASAFVSVTRGEFLRNAISTLRLPLDRDGVLSFDGVSPAMAPYVRTAEKTGALSAYVGSGKTLDLEKPVLRGEAVLLLSLLADVSSTPSLKTYSDVRTPQQKRAVAVALEQRWLRPLRQTLFGWSRPLSLNDEHTMLHRLAQDVLHIGPVPQTITVPITPAAVIMPKQDVQQTVWDLLNRDYLYKDRIKGDETGFKAIEGMVDSLGDPYTTYMRPASARDFQTQIQGEVTGIGAQVEQKAGVLIIVAPLKGSPAEKAGLLPGDEILAADGLSLAGMSYQEAVDHVRGEKGSTVRLHIRRNGSEMDVSVVRDLIRLPDMEVSSQGDITVVTLHQFGQITDSDFRNQMQTVADQHPRGIILDLRNNPGGLLHAAGVVAGVFLPQGSAYVTINTRDQSVPELTEDPPLIDPAVRVVLLVNKGSASAAEIVAGALQDAGRATLVGEKTFGKGTVQQVVEFTDGSSLKMTIAEWRTPKGRKIDGIGIDPDYLVTATTENDAPMEKAIELLR